LVARIKGLGLLNGPIGLGLGKTGPPIIVIIGLRKTGPPIIVIVGLGKTGPPIIVVIGLGKTGPLIIVIVATVFDLAPGPGLSMKAGAVIFVNNRGGGWSRLNDGGGSGHRGWVVMVFNVNLSVVIVLAIVGVIHTRIGGQHKLVDATGG
jgi:hypothetical protein